MPRSASPHRDRRQRHLACHDPYIDERQRRQAISAADQRDSTDSRIARPSTALHYLRVIAAARCFNSEWLLRPLRNRGIEPPLIACPSSIVATQTTRCTQS